jgi:hypothetical protein
LFFARTREGGGQFYDRAWKKGLTRKRLRATGKQ